MRSSQQQFEKLCTSLACFVLILGFGNLSAAPPANLSEKGNASYAIIVSARQFCSTGVGIAGATPNVVLAFRELLGEQAADAAFKSLLTEATMAGKLYALCGIYFTDPEFFPKAVDRFKNSPIKVETFMGCIVGNEPVSSIVLRSGSDVVKLKDRNQTIQQWMKETKNTNGCVLDIAGGGWPVEFKGEPPSDDGKKNAQ